MRTQQLAFRVAAAWVFLAGLSLLFPAVGNEIFALRLTNWGVASEYGGLLVALGVFYWVFSNDVERYAPIMPVIAFGLLLNVIINVYWWATGHYALQSAVVNIVVGTGLALWFWVARPADRPPQAGGRSTQTGRS